MSYTTILCVTLGEGTEVLQELRNSWGSAPVIWDAMSQKYLSTKPFAYSMTIEDLWPMWRSSNVPEYQRAVLAMTYDRAYITKEHYARASENIAAWLEAFPQKAGTANHWPAIRGIFGSDPECEAIGFRMTSVTENLFDGPWNEEKEDYDPLDWSTAFDVYAELDALKLEKAE